MVTHKRKKCKRMRGSQTHGWGAKKKHRGSGNKGGVGMASTGKRSDAKKPSIWKNPNYFGMRGFTPQVAREIINAVNISELPKYASGKSDINLADFGFNKLLATGYPDKAYNITVDYASANAIAKIEEAKGKVTVLKASKKESKADAN